jgi:hypothetical protein
LKRTIFFVLIILFAICGISNAEEFKIKINDKSVEEVSSVVLFKDELVAGEITFLVKSIEGVESLEISLDKGRIWNETEKKEDWFMFSYRPSDDEKLTLAFFIKDKNGSSRIYMPYITVAYMKTRPEEAIIKLLDKMKMFYEAEQKDKFMRLFSSAYPDSIKFEESIQNDFYNYNNIRLRYRPDRKSFSNDMQSAIWDVYWDRKYETRTGATRTDSATISMELERDGLEWVVRAFNNNTIFGSSLLVDYPDLVIANSDITNTGTTAYADVHNNNAVAASVVKVKFYYKSGGSWIAHGTESTITTLAANSQSTVSHTYTGFSGAYDLKVVVDEANTVAESSDINNSAEASVTFGQPDLQPTDLASNWPIVAPTATATIKNNGTGDASNIQVKIYSNTVLFYTVTIPSLAAGAQTTVSELYPNYGTGPTIKVVVDGSDSITESNEANNEYSEVLP